MSAHAKTSPVVSTMVISMTMTIAMMAAALKVGAPKWNGVVTPNQAASATRLKSAKPKIAPTAVPTTSPIRTAIVATNPLKNL